MDNNNRFVKFEERMFLSTIHNFYSEFLGDYLAQMKSAKWNHLKWKGLTLMKDPMSLTIYQQLIQDLRPKTILEFGTYEGGSALWMQDLLDTFGIDGTIHTFDINPDQVNLPSSERIVFHQLDNNKIKQYVADNRAFFENLPGPILLIEDAHENAAELLAVLDEFLKPGDYLVVEDTLSEWKHDMTGEFASQFPYQVDTHYCDFWGYNNSWNVNSFLVKC